MKRLFYALLGFSFCFLLSALHGGTREVIRIAGDSDYLPYEFIDDNGMSSGYNVELSRIIAERLGREPRFYLRKWANVIELLDDGKVDVIQGMAFSPERAKNYYFSEPHASTSRAIFVRKNSGLTKISDIMNKSVIIQQDDIAGEYLAGIGFKGEVYPVPSQEIALKLLDMGDYDAVVVNYMTGLYVIRSASLRNLEVLPGRIYERDYCYASKDPQLIEEINAVLASLEASGEIKELHDKWFGSNLNLEYDIASFLRYASMLGFLIVAMAVVFFVMLNICRRKSRESQRIIDDLKTQRDHLSMECDIWQTGFTKSPCVISKKGYSANEVYYISQNFRNWGFDPEEVMNKEFDFCSLIFSEDVQRVKEKVQAIEINDNIAIPYRLMNSNGEIFWVIDFILKVRCPHKDSDCFFSYMVDITEQKNREAKLFERMHSIQEASSIKSHYLARMSHEIRTPLNGLTGFLQVLMQMPTTPEIREIYEIMFNSGFSLLRIVNDVLDYSKLESGKVQLVPRNFNLRSLFDELIKEFEPRAKAKNLELVATVHESIPPIVLGDVYRLRQILVNLLQNALKFTHSGKIALSAELYTKSDSDTRVLFLVSDTGVGIDTHKQQDIFDNFTQADNSIVAKYGGTGLGLAIVKRLVELMNGFVWVESEPGKGSNFFFIISFEQYEKEERIHDEKEYVNVQDLSALKGRVLLVENDELNQLMTIRQLQNWGLDVTLAQNGEEALQIYHDHDFDIVLMDLYMPVMDGFRTATEMRKRDSNKGTHTTIIAYTASAEDEVRNRSLEAGMDEFIAKPVAMYDLYNLLTKHLES